MKPFAISVLLALLGTIAVAQTSPLYLPFDADLAGNLFLDTVELPYDGETIASPNGLRAFWGTFPDFMRESPWSTTFYIDDLGDDSSEVLRLQIDRHANVTPTARWVNDELLYLQVWWGRIAGSDLILDVVTGEFIYHRMFYFPPELPPTTVTPDGVPRFRFSVEHVQGAQPSEWQALEVLSEPDVRQLEVTILQPMVTNCFAELGAEDLEAVHAWLERFLQEQLEDAPPRPTETVCRNCTSYRLSWQLDGGQVGFFDFSEARPYRYPALDILFPLLERLLEDLAEEGECDA